MIRIIVFWDYIGVPLFWESTIWIEAKETTIAACKCAVGSFRV